MEALRDKCIEDLKEAQAIHTTDTNELCGYLCSVIGKATERRIKGEPCRIPIVPLQCATPSHSVANGGHSSGGPEYFEDNISCRNASILFEMLPQDIDLGLINILGVNAYDECPVGTCVDGILIIKCPIWIIIIAMERADLINIFAKYSKMLGASLFLGGIGGTSTGVNFLYRYIDLNNFDVIVKPITHISNASTPRWRAGWGWPSKDSQTVRVTKYFDRFSKALVHFYEMSGTTLHPTPLQAMVNHPKLIYVRDLSSIDASVIARWDLTPEGKAWRNTQRVQLSDEAIATRLESGLYRKMADGRIRKVCFEYEQLWNLRLEELKEFKRVHGHCNVPTLYPSNKQLGSWVGTQRSQYFKFKDGKAAKITQERIDALNELGLQWALHEDKWNLRLEELKEFKRVHGHCNVPTLYPSNKQLGSWVGTQRSQYFKFKDGKAAKITQERIDALNELGFQWVVCRGGSRPSS